MKPGELFRLKKDDSVESVWSCPTRSSQHVRLVTTLTPDDVFIVLDGYAHDDIDRDQIKILTRNGPGWITVFYEHFKCLEALGTKNETR